MPHVDEGTLHALLDGELAPAEAAEVRVHFATCPSCAARLDEARQLLAETERLVSALELPGGASQAGGGNTSAGRPADPRPAAAAAAAVADVLLPPGPSTPLPPLDPVVLIPENPTVREVRRSRMRVMAWAAGFLVVVGAGFLGVTSYRAAPRNPDGRLRISPDEFTTAPPRADREGAAADSAPTLSLTDSAVPPIAPANAPAPEAESKAESAAPAPKPPPPTPTPTPTPAPRPAGAARAADAEESLLAKAAESPPRESAQPAQPVQPRREQPVSRTAAQATSDLDRRRTRERAAQATAELDRELAQQRAAAGREQQIAAERAAAAAPPATAPTAAPAAAPARPPVDERTGISSRIGLDEAARQLGGPLHAIDGMTRQMVGLVSGTSVEGADPARPVVRAVYVDRASGTMLFLDQQMARPGEGPATPQTGRGGRQVWVKDGVLLVLHGDLGADSLRSLARRVR
jgi:hypothetical protein